MSFGRGAEIDLLWGFSLIAARLSGASTTAKPLPPDCGIVGTVENLRQLLLDFQQASGAHFQGGPVYRAVRALLRIASIEVPQICDFVAQAGEMFRDIRHILIIQRIGRSAALLSDARPLQQAPNPPVLYYL